MKKLFDHNGKLSCMSDNKGIICTANEKQMTDVLEAMNTIVRFLNDEEAYYGDWIDLVPDEADREELEDIVQNYPDLIDEIIPRFAAIVKHYMK